MAESPSTHYLTPSQAAKLLGVAEQTLAQWRYYRKGPAFIRISKSCIRYRQGDLEDYMQSCTIEPL